jgi:transcriptional regulator with XRE-family HTH domain
MMIMSIGAVSARKIAIDLRTFSRLCGFHNISHQEALMVEMSPQSVSMWRAGKRKPSGDALIQIGSFFGLDPVMLTQQPMIELLPAVAEQTRFASVERKITKSRGRRRGIHIIREGKSAD